MQSEVVDTSVHLVEQWSSQHSWQEAWQSVDDVAVEPSGPDEEVEDEEHDELQPDSHREEQSVVQSNLAGLLAHVVEQLDWQLDVQVDAAVALHWALHCCSSFAAHAFSQLGGAHCVVQLSCVTRVQCALASTKMSPHGERESACAICGVATTSALVTALTTRDPETKPKPRRCVVVLMAELVCNRQTRREARVGSLA